MYLIRSKIARNETPPTLPPSLIPPSLRPAVPLSPVHPPPALQQPQPTPRPAPDLFIFDDAFHPPVAPHATPPNTGMSSPPGTISPPQAASSPKPVALQRPFKPQSSFGRGIVDPGRSTPPPVQVPMTSGSVFGDGDLLGDSDPEISAKLTSETAELANLSNQIGSLNNATRELQSNKAKAELELASVSEQKRDIE